MNDYNQDWGRKDLDFLLFTFPFASQNQCTQADICAFSMVSFVYWEPREECE